MTDSGRCKDVQQVLSSLLVSKKDDCTIEELERDYQEVEGERIPWRELGYATLLSFLQSSSKYVTLINNNGRYFVKPVVTEKVQHVKSLVDRQKSSVRRSCRGRRPYFNVTHRPPFRRLSAQALGFIMNNVRENPHGLSLDYILKMLHFESLCYGITITNLSDQLQAVSHQLVIRGNKVYPTECAPVPVVDKDYTNENERSASYAGSSIIMAGEEDERSDDNEDEVYLCPAGYTSQPCVKSRIEKSVSDFVADSISRVQEEQNYISEASCAKEEVKKNEEIFTNIDQSEQENHDSIELEYENNYEEVCDSETVSELINTRIRFRLEKLIQAHPDGIYCADLPEMYLNVYGLTLNYSELGFSSVCEFAVHLPDIFHCIQPSKTEDFILFDAKAPIPDIQKRDRPSVNNLSTLYSIYDELEEVEPLPTNVSNDISQRLIPEDVMTFGETVGQVSIVGLGPLEKQYEEVIVVEVFTPSYFWIHLRRKRRRFDDFMDELHIFYKENSSRYMIPPVILEKGLNCACLFLGKWHRAIIKSVSYNGSATVLFYDYGTLKTYPHNELYFLHRRFSYLPAQAIPCGLYNTKPCKGVEWTRSVTTIFTKMTVDIPMIAIIAKTDLNNNSMLITLVDTRGDEDVHICDWMVQNQLAEYGSLGSTVDTNSKFIEDDDLIVADCESKAAENEDFTATINNECDERNRSENVPLISPQSTLEDKPINPPPGLNLLKDPVDFASFVEGEQKENGLFDANSNYTTSPKCPNCAAFEKNELSCKTELCAHMFMKMWMQLLLFQSQITATMKILISKLAKREEGSADASLQKVMEQLLTQGDQLYDSLNPFHNSKYATNEHGQSADETANGFKGFINGFANESDCAQAQRNVNEMKGTRDPFCMRNVHDVPGTSDHIQRGPINTVNNATGTFNPNVASKEAANEIQETSQNTYTTESEVTFQHDKKSSVEPTSVQNVFDKNQLKPKLDADKNGYFVPLNNAYWYGLSNHFEQTPNKHVEPPNVQSKNPFREYMTDSILTESVAPNVAPIYANATPFANFGHFTPEQNYRCDTENNNSNVSASIGVTKSVYESNPMMYNMNTHEKRMNSKIRNCQSKTSGMVNGKTSNSSSKSAQTSKKSDTESFSSSQKFYKQDSSSSWQRVNTPKPNTFQNEIDLFYSTIKGDGLSSDNTNEVHAVPKRPKSLNPFECDDSSESISSSSPENFAFIEPPTRNVETPLSPPLTSANPMCYNVEDAFQMPKQSSSIGEFLKERSNNLNKDWFVSKNVGQIDEGYPSSPSDSQTLAGSPNFVQKVNEPYLEEEPKRMNVFNNIPSTERTTTSESPFFNTEDEYQELRQQNNKGPSCLRQQGSSAFLNFQKYNQLLSNSVSMEAEDSHNSMTQTNLSASKGNIKITSLTGINSSSVPAKSHPLLFQPVKLTGETMYIFFLEDEGWLSTEEFVDVFTDFKVSSVMLKLLDITNVNVAFKSITRKEYPLLFTQLDKSSLKVKRTCSSKIKSPLHLMPLKSAIRLLAKLKIVSMEEINKAVGMKEFKEGSPLHKVMILITTYSRSYTAQRDTER
ncbi:uncharacterized protein LOC105701330 isoform X2 [Orussus abietinus]|uniref:uncharacterized protein LOC105701330 isoform X2 n=1 Tax=Orussus abietinus TaxID=222816 RepID=UPI0006259496|nr:uncharacterized protein LOC105701330 isoform X2 [Orussus abietinus]